MTHQNTRRGFLKTTATAAAAFAVPMYVPASSFGANDRIVTGHIGVGGRGKGNLSQFTKLATPAAVCDVDRTNRSKAAELVRKQSGGKVMVTGDYREILERKDIDAVVISTPDHWHALPTIEACQAGKDVYCEKPLTLTVVEGRKMVEAARANKRVVQTGSQQRSSANFRTACELVRSGAIGKVKTVLVGIAKANHPGAPVPDSDPPEGLDYDRWLGPAPLRPYNKKRVHYNFRFFWDYSGGQMTNWGAHHIDIAHWGLGMDESGPLTVSGEATFHPRKWHEVSETCRITYTYPNDVTMIVGQLQDGMPMGTTFIGTEGRIYVNRGKLQSDPGEILKAKRTVSLYESGNHYQDFLNCVKTREKPICDVEIGHRTATACHLGNIAIRTGRKVEWDASRETITNDDELAGMLHRPYRAPWHLA